VTDRLRDTTNIGKNRQRLVHSMRHIIIIICKFVSRFVVLTTEAVELLLTTIITTTTTTTTTTVCYIV